LVSTGALLVLAQKDSCDSAEPPRERKRAGCGRV